MDDRLVLIDEINRLVEELNVILRHQGLDTSVFLHQSLNQNADLDTLHAIKKDIEKYLAEHSPTTPQS